MLHINACVSRGRSRRGFSLIEIIVAVSIMVILMGAAIPVVSVAINRTKKNETREELNALKTAIEDYFHDIWILPSDLEELLMNSSKVDGWTGPYINPPVSKNQSTLPAISKDAWNSDYIITYTGSSGMNIKSPGSDCSSGTDDDIEVDVDVTYIRRDATLDELKIINTAIQSYNDTYLKSEPLTPNWTLIFLKLVSKGYLPGGDSSLKTDGWGDNYVPDPTGQTPVVSITSSNVDYGDSGSGGGSVKGKGGKGGKGKGKGGKGKGKGK